MIEVLGGDNLYLWCFVLLDLVVIGYLLVVKVILEILVENSMKLIVLKGFLEYYFIINLKVKI